MSHLLSLREEEDIAGDDVVDESPLTYDRPDNYNKVTLRRSATGLWQVCSSGQKDGLNKEPVMRDHPVKKKRQKHINSTNVDVEDDKNMEIALSTLQCGVTSCDLLQSNVVRSPREGRISKSSVTSQKQRRSPRELSSSKCVTLNPPIPRRSTNNPDLVSANSVMKNVDGDSCIGSRIRQKNLHESGSTMSLLDRSSSSSFNESPPNHKYQTRLKVTRDL